MVGTLLLTVAVLSVESGQAPGMSGFERVLVVAPDGTVVGTANGESDRVAISADLDRELVTPGARLRLSHNHPAGTSLSAADFGQLAKTGLETIEARGDGSRYRASAPMHDPYASKSGCTGWRERRSNGFCVARLPSPTARTSTPISTISSRSRFTAQHC